MIIRRNRREEGQGEAARNPYIHFELIDGKHLDVSVAWSPDDDVESFARMLLLICRGRVVGAISASVAIQGSKIGQGDQAAAIHAVLDEVSRPAPEPPPDDYDEPLVCPTEAIKLNTKSFLG